MAKLLAALDCEPLANVRLYDDDAVRLLDWLPDGSLGGIDLFYPDPWPKKKHWKRRFVSPGQSRPLRARPEAGRHLSFCLRHRQLRELDAACNVARHPDFLWTARSAADWRRPFPDWPGTRYEAKAIREGRRPAYLAFVRR